MCGARQPPSATARADGEETLPTAQSDCAWGSFHPLRPDGDRGQPRLVAQTDNADCPRHSSEKESMYLEVHL